MPKIQTAVDLVRRVKKITQKPIPPTVALPRPMAPTAVALPRPMAPTAVALPPKTAAQKLHGLDVFDGGIQTEAFGEKAVNVGEAVEGTTQNVAALTALAMKYGGRLAPALANSSKLGAVSSGASRVAAPLNAVLQGVDALRLVADPEYRQDAAEFVGQVADRPDTILNGRYFNTTVAANALSRAPSTIYSLGHEMGKAHASDVPFFGDVEDIEGFSPGRMETHRQRKNWKYNEREFERAVPPRDFHETRSMGIEKASRKRFRL